MAQGLTQTRLSLILRTEPIFEVGMSRPYKEIDPIQLNQLTDKYSDKEIGEMLGHSRWTITQARFRFEIKSFYEKTGFKRNVKGDAGNTYGGRKRQHSFNEHFFSVVETEAQAYFLGFLAADGCVRKQLDGVELTLQEKDVEILTLFKEVLGGTSSDLYYKEKDIGSNAYRLMLMSKQMALDLNSWGITPAKSHTMQIQKPIPEHLLRHFLRGLWDGDGSISEKSFSLLTASALFADQLEGWIFDVSKINVPRGSQKSRENRYPYFRGCTKKHGLFLKAIYEDCSYFLERKLIQYSRFWA